MTIDIKKVGNKVELTETKTEIKVTEYTLDELQQQLDDAKKSRDSIVQDQQNTLSYYDATVTEKQKNLDDAIALGIT